MYLNSVSLLLNNDNTANAANSTSINSDVKMGRQRVGTLMFFSWHACSVHTNTKISIYLFHIWLWWLINALEYQSLKGEWLENKTKTTIASLSSIFNRKLSLTLKHNGFCVQLYVENRNTIRSTLTQLAPSLPSYHNLEWRLDVQVGTTSVHPAAICTHAKIQSKSTKNWRSGNSLHESNLLNLLNLLLASSWEAAPCGTRLFPW